MQPLHVSGTVKKGDKQTRRLQEYSKNSSQVKSQNNNYNKFALIIVLKESKQTVLSIDGVILTASATFTYSMATFSSEHVGNACLLMSTDK